MRKPSKEAMRLVRKFRFGNTAEDCIVAALEMKTHFYSCQDKNPRDKVGEEILNLFWPLYQLWLKSEPEETASFLGRPVWDMTRGRPDTVEWLLFLKIVARDNPYYYEYDNALKTMTSHDQDERKWRNKISAEIPRHKLGVVSTSAATIEEAARDANLKLPAGSTILKRIDIPPSRRVHQFNAFDDASARKEAENCKEQDEHVESVSLKRPARKKFLWKKATPPLYEAKIARGEASITII